MGLFRKDKTRIIAKFHRADLAICSHSGERKNWSYSQTTMVTVNETAFRQTTLPFSFASLLISQ